MWEDWTENWINASHFSIISHSHEMIKADVRGLIKTENIRLIKKPLNHLTSLIYFIITLFSHCLKVPTPQISVLIMGPMWSNVHIWLCGHLKIKIISIALTKFMDFYYQLMISTSCRCAINTHIEQIYLPLFILALFNLHRNLHLSNLYYLKLKLNYYQYRHSEWPLTSIG